MVHQVQRVLLDPQDHRVILGITERLVQKVQKVQVVHMEVLGQTGQLVLQASVQPVPLAPAVILVKQVPRVTLGLDIMAQQVQQVQQVLLDLLLVKVRQVLLVQLVQVYPVQLVPLALLADLEHVLK